MINHFYTHPNRRTFRHKNADPQRGPLYKMERDIVGNAIDTFTPLDKLQGIANHACRLHKCKKVKVRGYAKDERIFGYCNEKGIFLNRNFHGHNLAVMLHELAHWICFENFPEATDHGPQFVTIYRALLDQYKILPAVCFDVLAEIYGVEHNGF